MILRAFVPHTQPVEVGSSYRRVGAGGIIELARVLDLGTDKLGIPHVRFTLQVGSGGTKTVIEARTLSLEAFQTRYREKIAALEPVHDL